jgi:hypothetical protein
MNVRATGLAALAITMFVSSTFAATDTPAANPLAPGKPPGVKQAKIEVDDAELILGGVVVAGMIALIAPQTQGNSTPTN